MNRTHYSPNPHDNQDFLRERLQQLTEEQKVELLMVLSTQRYRQAVMISEMQGTIQRQERQYDRALTRIGILQKELKEIQEHAA